MGGLTDLYVIAKGEEYWRLERAISAAMLRHPRCSADSAPKSARHLSIDQIHEASLAKSFDYRVHCSSLLPCSRSCAHSHSAITSHA